MSTRCGSPRPGPQPPHAVEKVVQGAFSQRFFREAFSIVFDAAVAALSIDATT
jgi:hypothetical protein